MAQIGKIPQIEVKYIKGRRQYYINGVKVTPSYRYGVRPKIVLPEVGIVIKFPHFSGAYKHIDGKIYKKIKRSDKKYFPKLLKETSQYSVHEFVPHRRLNLNKVEDFELYEKAEALKKKYGFRDFGTRQIAKRLDNSDLVYFDYGFVNIT